jgi:hypothetical protein
MTGGGLHTGASDPAAAKKIDARKSIRDQAFQEGILFQHFHSKSTLTMYQTYDILIFGNVSYFSCWTLFL